MDHAVLAPSSSGRWLVCTPSARLELEFENLESDFAREGTLAHSIGEALLRGFVHSGLILLTLTELQAFQKEEFYTESMYEYSQDYAAYVLSYYQDNDLLFIEQEVDLSDFIPESFGHSDASVLKIAEKHLHVFDYKFGKGVFVSAEDNKQLKIYAQGILNKIDFLGYDIEKVTLHIYQPRMQNIESFELSIYDLTRWINFEVKPKAQLAFKGEGEFVPGEHCLFCNAKPRCKALAEYNLALGDYDFQNPALLKDAEIIEILNKQSIFESWIKAVDDYALAEAIKGRGWKGYKLVEGKSNRIYKDETEVVKVLQKNLNFGYLSEIYKPQQLLGLGDLEKKLGKENFAKYVTPLLVKPPGAPTLAVETDKRPEYNKANIDFKDDWIEPFDPNDL